MMTTNVVGNSVFEQTMKLGARRPDFVFIDKSGENVAIPDGQMKKEED